MKIFSIIALSLVLSTGANAQNQRAGDAEKPVPSIVEGSPVSDADDAAQTETAEIKTLSFDASDKTDFLYFGLQDGLLVPVTEADTWIFGVRRYIFKTQTGSNGPFTGGTSVAAGEGFSAFQTCAKLDFEADEVVTMLGYTISANTLMTSEWYDYNDLGTIEPMDKFFAIARDTDCLKVKILSYTAGVYEIEYSQIP